MTPDEIKKHYKKELKQAEIVINRLENDRLFQSRILNTIREHLITRTKWNGVFLKGEDLSTIVLELLEKKDVEPRSIN
jgi:hypothetical protein